MNTIRRWLRLKMRKNSSPFSVFAPEIVGIFDSVTISRILEN